MIGKLLNRVWVVLFSLSAFTFLCGAGIAALFAVKSPDVMFKILMGGAISSMSLLVVAWLRFAWRQC